MLKEEGMVNQSRYGRVTLTPEGKEYAAIVWRAHRALRAFLETDLGVEAEQADEEACLMEHAISDESFKKWSSYINKLDL